MPSSNENISATKEALSIKVTHNKCTQMNNSAPKQSLTKNIYLLQSSVHIRWDTQLSALVQYHKETLNQSQSDMTELILFRCGKKKKWLEDFNLDCQGLNDRIKLINSLLTILSNCVSCGDKRYLSASEMNGKTDHYFAALQEVIACWMKGPREIVKSTEWGTDKKPAMPTDRWRKAGSFLVRHLYLLAESLHQWPFPSN